MGLYYRGRGGPTARWTAAGVSAHVFLIGALLYGIGPMFSVWLAIGGVAVFSAGCILFGLRLTRPQKAI